RLEMNRVEPELLDLNEVRRARGHRAGNDGAVTAQSRDVARVDLNALGRPCSALRQGPVFEGDGAVDHRKSIDCDVDSLLGRPRAFDQIGEVEMLPEPDDTQHRLAYDQLPEPAVGADERQQAQSLR